MADPLPLRARIEFRLRRIRWGLGRVRTSDWIASVAALAAVVSLVISILGYRVVAEQTALTKAQFQQSRSFVWICSVDDGLNLTLTPSRDDVAVESVVVVFPKSLFAQAEECSLKPRDLRLSLKNIHERLLRIRASSVTFDKATGGYLFHTVSNILPLMVESRYAIGGSIQSDRSLFFLRIITEFTMGPTGVDNVTLERLSLSDAFFYGKLANDDDDTDEILSGFWNLSSDAVARVEPQGGKVSIKGPFPPRGKKRTDR